MQSISTFRTWVSANRDLAIEAMRVYLGFGLFLKGINLIYAASQIAETLKQSVDFPFFPFAMVHVVGLAHICGGILLCVGLMTRLAAFIQIPAAFGAIVYVHWSEGFFSLHSSLEFDVTVFLLLTMYVIYGSGRFSVDTLLARKRYVSND